MKSRQDARERLIDAAHRLAMRKGFARTSVSELLAESGTKRGSLYHYFPGKDDLGLAVLERAGNEFMAMLESTLAGPDPSAALDRFFDTVLHQHRTTGFVGGCLWGNTALEMSDTSPAYAKLVTKVFDEWLTRIGRVMRQGQEAGKIRDDLPAPDLARLVVAGVEGGIMMSRLTKEEDPFKTCLDSLRALLTERGDAPGSQATTFARRHDASGRKPEME